MAFHVGIDRRLRRCKALSVLPGASVYSSVLGFGNPSFTSWCTNSMDPGTFFGGSDFGCCWTTRGGGGGLAVLQGVDLRLHLGEQGPELGQLCRGQSPRAWGQGLPPSPRACRSAAGAVQPGFVLLSVAAVLTCAPVWKTQIQAVRAAPTSSVEHQRIRPAWRRVAGVPKAGGRAVIGLYSFRVAGGRDTRGGWCCASSR